MLTTLEMLSTEQTLSTLLVDLHPDAPATSQAALNMVRCTLSAAGVAVLQIIIDSLGLGWCFTILSGTILATLPLLWMEKEWGMGWRLKSWKLGEERAFARRLNANVSIKIKYQSYSAGSWERKAMPMSQGCIFQVLFDQL